MITFTKDYSGQNRLRYKITTIKKDGLKRTDWVNVEDSYIKMVGIESCSEVRTLNPYTLEHPLTYTYQYVVTCRSIFVYVQGRNDKEDKKIAIIKRSLPHIPFLNDTDSKDLKNWCNGDRIYVHDGMFYGYKYQKFQPYVP